MALHCYYQAVSGLIIILSLMNANIVQSRSTTNACLDYCSSGGTCLRSNNGPKCICLPEWTGERCDIPQKPNLTQQLRTARADVRDARNDPCDFAPKDFCQNDGICYVDSGDLFACYCRYPYVGANCEELSECYNYCLNNGACKLDSSDAPSCDCQPGWNGNRCQKVVTTPTVPTVPTVPTTTTPTTPSISCTRLGATYCNSGTCVAVNNVAQCQCPPTHTGPRCETLAGVIIPTGPATVTVPTLTPSLSPTITLPPTAGPDMACSQQTCQNNGVCYNNGNSYFCFCNSRYTGKNCEIPLQ